MKSSRPPLLIILVIAGLAGCFLNMIMVISPAVRNTANWYPLYLSLSTIYSIICLGGLGLMKKWAVFAYSGYAVAHQLVHLYLGNWNGFAFILPVAITGAGWIYFREMG